MRPVQNSKTFIYFDNAQCRCFQSPQPVQQFFLNKNEIPSNLKEKNKMPISENIKHTLSKTNVKRSLKRVTSPSTNEVIQERSIQIDEKSAFRGSIHRNTQEITLFNFHKSPMNAYELKKQNVNVTTINFNRPQYDYNTCIKLNSPIFQQQPYQQVINHQKKVSALSYTTNPFERIQISKKNFNFIPTATAHQQPTRLIQKTTNTKQMQNLQSLVTLTTQKKLSQPENATIKKVSQQIKIPKLKKKESVYECFDLGHKQTATKNSIMYSGVNTSSNKTEIGDKIQMTETAAGVRDFSELDNKNEARKISQTTILKQNTNEAPKISQTTILKQNTHKSVLKTKRSLLSDTNRSKIVVKKQKPKTLLSKMQDVQQIRSLANSDQDDDSDKESVVLERLNEYNEVKVNTIISKNIAPAKLERDLQFIQNQNSMIIDSTFGEWKNEFQSQFGY